MMLTVILFVRTAQSAWNIGYNKGDIMKIDRQAVYDKYNGHCAYCGEIIEYKDMQVDHILCRNRSHWIGHERMMQNAGLNISHIDDFGNLNPSCRVCNLFKGVFSIKELRKQLAKQVERANKYSVNYRMAKKYGLIIETSKPVVFYFERDILKGLI